MDDKQLGASLVKLDSASAAHAASDVQVQRILARDLRWIRLWTVVTIAAWIPAVLLILGVLIYLGLLFPLQARLDRMHDGHSATHGEAADGNEDVAVPSFHSHDHAHELDLPHLEHDTDIGFKVMSVLTGLAVLALSAALLCSFVVTQLTRRATLRQINAQLVVISAQLKGLQRATPAARD